ncbi:MAG: tRNA (adenosine(37)-N6)-threonylcarbamoyltransferase complex ATPase subunit type 1 TsaE [Planctomycetes bacterium]|nr:tRNA (adenosine(37)-N6)-threonylcarbamoyltransferase complex ATPase subunit type 1 TsaE [Planctomycetota bacterium]MCB9904024.1 tRNA (adenosine(37)-N6)-threonylcarbamoyltransferase complex ATPase subunit type 1 TsaE [Planctomycetota bacterium]
MAAESLVFRSGSTESTEALARALGAIFQGGELIALDGELGAGKTAFVRGLARGLGIEGPVSSPTFTLMQEYEGRLLLRHFDAWMESRERSFLADGGSDALEDGAVCAVEWSERVADWLPEPYLRVALAHLGSEERRVTLEVVGEGPAADRLRAALAALQPIPGLEPLR